jgi:hypothetical protein
MTTPARLPRSVPTRAGGVHVGTYDNEIQSAHWKLITDLATQLGCSVPIYGLARALETHLRASVSSTCLAICQLV